MKNSIKEMVLETIEGLYKNGTVDEPTLKEVQALAASEKAKKKQAKANSK